MALEWLQNRVPEYMRSLAPYEPGKSIDELRRELGLERIVKVASNENSLGPSAATQKALADAVPEVFLYPDGAAYELKQALAAHYADYGVRSENVITGNGSNEVLELLMRLMLRPGDEVVYPWPAFVVYHLGTQGNGAVRVPVKLTDEYRVDLDGLLSAITDKTRLVCVDSPNNPSGTACKLAEVESFLEQVPEQTLVIWDEAYGEYVTDPKVGTALSLRDKFPNLIVMRTFSKAYGLAALRCGYGIAHEAIGDLINRIRQPFNCNGAAQTAAAAALKDQAHIERTREMNNQGMQQLETAFERLGVEYVPSQANFMLVHVGDADGCFQGLLKRGVIVRSMKGLTLPEHVRITISNEEENTFMLTALEDWLKETGRV